MSAVLDEVMEPDMVGPLRSQPRTRTVIEPETGPLVLFRWDFQPFTLPDTLDSPVVHVPACLVEQPRHCRPPATETIVSMDRRPAVR